ncbi:MAG: hypothetical protein LBJ09_02740 [Clostridiales bacterium]|jgi:hypothetical protein|nr:hypothetical protein [Clostridiales bacterium]
MLKLNPFKFENVFAAASTINQSSSDAVIDWGSIVNPIMALIDSLLIPALFIVGSIGAIFCIIIGVKFAKADEQQEREKAKGSLKNAAIGFIMIFIMIAVLKLGLGPLINWVTQITS